MSETRKKIAIKIKPTVWRRAKIAAINFDITVSELVETALEWYIKKRSDENVSN